MGRPQAFDTTEAVRAARQVFWNQGYEEAAMPALEAATGLCRSSIYHAFGNKRGLFDAAVTSYLDEVVRPRLRPLLTAPVSPEAVGDYLRTLRGAIAGRTGAASADGCLLINTAASTLAGDAAVKQVISDYRAELATAMRSGINARRPELAAASAERLAQTCTALIIAAFTIARADPQGAIAYLDLAADAVEQR